MKVEELKELWAANEKKVDRSLKLNLILLKTIQTQKMESSLKKLMWQRIITIPIMLLVLVIVAILIKYHYSQPLVLLSLILYATFQLFGIYVFIQNIVTIRQIDFSAGIPETQRKLGVLQLSIIQTTRLTFLMLPVIVLLYDSFGYSQHTMLFWVIKLVIFVIVAGFSVWLYTNFTIGSIHKPWVKNMLSFSYGRSITETMGFLKEIEEFQKVP